MRIKDLSILPFLLLVLAGCGNDTKTEKSISELQERLLKIENDLQVLQQQNESVKKNEDSIEYLKPKIQRLQTDLQKLLKSVSSGEGQITKTNEAFESPEALKKAQDKIMSQANTLSAEHKKSIALIRSYLRTSFIKDIPEKLNSNQMYHPDDGSKWDQQKLIRYIELYNISKEPSAK